MVVRDDDFMPEVSHEKGFYVDKQFLAAPVKNSVDKYQLVPEFLKVRGLVKQHLDSFNYFIQKQIHKIVEANNRIEVPDRDAFIRSVFLVKFQNFQSICLLDELSCS